MRQAIATTNLALSCQGRPVAWLADGDALLFHGEPATTDTAPENVYWVAPGPGTGMAVATAAFPAEPATNACFAESRFFQGTNHLTRVSYNSRTDLPFVAYGLRSNTSADKSLTSIEPVDDPAPGAWTGTVSVTFLSYYENSEVDEHAVAVSVGGVPVGHSTWSGERLLTHVFSLPSSALDGAAAAVTVRHVAPPPPLMTTDYTRFVWLSCELAYPRAYRARGGALLCRGGGGNLSAVSGFPSNDVVVLDVTVPRAPVVIAPVALAWEGREAGWTAAFPSGGADQAYQVFSRSAGIRRPSVRGVRDLDWMLSPVSPTSFSYRPRDGAAASARRCSRWRIFARRLDCGRSSSMLSCSTTSSAAGWSIRWRSRPSAGACSPAVSATCSWPAPAPSISGTSGSPSTTTRPV